MCSRCPVMSLSWREAHNSLDGCSSLDLKCILNFETNRQMMWERNRDVDSEEIFLKKRLLMGKKPDYHY